MTPTEDKSLLRRIAVGVSLSGAASFLLWDDKTLLGFVLASGVAFVALAHIRGLRRELAGVRDENNLLAENLYSADLAYEP